MIEAQRNDNDQPETPPVARVGDATGEAATNTAKDTDRASMLATLLEGIKFPATKDEIQSHINAKSPSGEIGIHDFLKALEQNLDENALYSNTYEVELAIGLVSRSADTNANSPYARDKALNRANSRRLGERMRADPYTEHESVGVASSRDVSPNTPKGESV